MKKSAQLDHLPDHIIMDIILETSPLNIANLCKANKRINALCLDPWLVKQYMVKWNINLDITNFPFLFFQHEKPNQLTLEWPTKYRGPKKNYYYIENLWEPITLKLVRGPKNYFILFDYRLMDPAKRDISDEPRLLDDYVARPPGYDPFNYSYLEGEEREMDDIIKVFTDMGGAWAPDIQVAGKFYEGFRFNYDDPRAAIWAARKIAHWRGKIDNVMGPAKLFKKLTFKQVLEQLGYYDLAKTAQDFDSVPDMYNIIKIYLRDRNQPSVKLEDIDTMDKLRKCCKYKGPETLEDLNMEGDDFNYLGKIYEK